MIEKCNMENINTTQKEGKYLLAAVSLLTTQKFEFYGKVINGAEKHPDEIFELLGKLAKDINTPVKDNE